MEERVGVLQPIVAEIKPSNLIRIMPAEEKDYDNTKV